MEFVRAIDKTTNRREPNTSCRHRAGLGDINVHIIDVRRNYNVQRWTLNENGNTLSIEADADV